MSRSVRYGMSDATTSLDHRIDRLKLQLRNHMMYLHPATVLSKDWFNMAEHVVAVGKFASVERAAPIQVQKNVVQQTGRRSQGTLWDQEQDEIAVRVLIEEGKLNLSLRMLQEYMELALSGDAFKHRIKVLTDELPSSDEKVADMCEQYSMALGSILLSALRHVEVLQIVDIPCLIQHCRLVLHHDQGSTPEDGGKQGRMHTSIVLQYLQIIADNIEKLDEERVLELLDCARIVSLTTNYLAQQRTPLNSADDVAVAVLFLAQIFASELFAADLDRYVDGETRRALIDIKGTILEPQLQLITDAKDRRDLRLLLDRINLFARHQHQ